MEMLARLPIPPWPENRHFRAASDLFPFEDVG
jgi:hypothetical protein